MPVHREPDVHHTEPGASMSRHKYEYRDMCEICSPNNKILSLKPEMMSGSGLLTDKSKRSIFNALREFGYSGLSYEEIREICDRLMREQKKRPNADIIESLIYSQLVEAGVVVVEGGA